MFRHPLPKHPYVVTPDIVYERRKQLDFDGIHTTWPVRRRHCLPHHHQPLHPPSPHDHGPWDLPPYERHLAGQSKLSLSNTVLGMEHLYRQLIQQEQVAPRSIPEPQRRPSPSSISPPNPDLFELLPGVVGRQRRAGAHLPHDELRQRRSHHVPRFPAVASQPRWVTPCGSYDDVVPRELEVKDEWTESKFDPNYRPHADMAPPIPTNELNGPYPHQRIVIKQDDGDGNVFDKSGNEESGTIPASFDSATIRDPFRERHGQDGGDRFRLISPNVYCRSGGGGGYCCYCPTSCSCSPPPPPPLTGGGGGIDAERGRRLLFTRRVWDGQFQRWKPTERYHHPTHGTHTAMPAQYRIVLSRGGEINVFPYLVGSSRTGEIRRELLDPNRCHYFRSYCIQGGDEPRVHFLLHRDATHDFSRPQPGYEYARIKMKARPLGLFPTLEALSRDIGQLRDVPHWDIGIHTVLYRDGRDSMGDHADDDQGETKVFCVLVESPPTPRVIRINVFRKLTQTDMKDSNGRRLHHRNDGDEVIELHLQRGDAYEMDGIMQQSYSHGVPSPSPCHEGKVKLKSKIKIEPIATAKNDACASQVCGGGDATTSVSGVERQDSQPNVVTSDHPMFQRICVVLRTGIQKKVAIDSGRPRTNLRPKKPVSYFFGRNIPLLDEGEQFTLRELKDMGAFQAAQKGISGKGDRGADAIIVSGARKDRLGFDSFGNLMYAAEWRIGGNALWKSYIMQLPIRVFRSTRYKQSRFRAVPQQEPIRIVGSLIASQGSTPRYRYDGLYRIVRVHPPEHTEGPLLFFFSRLDHGRGIAENQIDTKVLMESILKQTKCTPQSKSVRQVGEDDDNDASGQNTFFSRYDVYSKDEVENESIHSTADALFAPYQDVPLKAKWSNGIKGVDELVACRAMMDILHTDCPSITSVDVS